MVFELKEIGFMLEFWGLRCAVPWQCNKISSLVGIETSLYKIFDRMFAANLVIGFKFLATFLP